MHRGPDRAARNAGYLSRHSTSSSSLIHNSSRHLPRHAARRRLLAMPALVLGAAAILFLAFLASGDKSQRAAAADFAPVPSGHREAATSTAFQAQEAHLKQRVLIRAAHREAAARAEAAADARQRARREAAADAAQQAAAAAAAAQAAQAQASAAPAPQQPAQGFSGPSGSFEACVIRVESGGNPQAVNPSSGAGGLFQFLPSTWAGLQMGYPGGAQTAPPGVQYAAFDKLYAEAGTAPWAGDGCA